MTPYTTMASLTLVLVLTWTLHAASFTLYQQEETNYQMTPVSHPEYKSTRKCVEDERNRSANCQKLKLRGLPDYLSPDIQILDLSFNNISELLNSSFSRYLHLTHLDISHNDVRYIEAATFQPLKYLLHLDISWNPQLVNLHPSVFKWTQRLSFIRIRRCGLTSFSENSTYVQHFKQLHFLMLDDNAITHINITCHPEIQIGKVSLRYNNLKEFTHQTFKLECDINMLELSGNVIKIIDPYTLASLHVQYFMFDSYDYTIVAEVWEELLSGIAMSNIKHLFLACVNCSVANPNFFSPLNDVHLSSLYFSSFGLSNDINTLFTSLDALLELIVGPSTITTLEPEYFFGMTALQILNFNRNQIKHINRSNSTWSMLQLREINLSYNKLIGITPNSFQGLVNLSVLDLSHNKKLAYIHKDAFSKHVLQVLNVSGTIVMNIDLVAPLLKSLTFRDRLYSCTILSMNFSHNHLIETIDLTNSELEGFKLLKRSTFGGLSNLVHLSLKGNPIFELQSGFFKGLSALEFLDLSCCQIASIQANTFRGLISLQLLALEGNSIQQLPVNLFMDLKQLLSCSLMKNSLNYLESQTFANTTSLKILLLAFNQFTDFNRSTFEPILDTARSIDISHNPIICNCELTWLVEWLKGPVDVLNITICSAGSGTLAPLRGKPLLTFNPDELCGPNILLLSLVPLAAIGLIASLFVLYHYRWYVRFKLYLLKLAVLGYEEVLDAREHGDFEFDLNIMFLEDDTRWVREYLKPVLEERLPNFNRNAIGDDDLILGMHYLDAVYYVIEKSFKTVILLSRAAVKDNWFMIKFRIAFEQVNDARMENVVLVFLEDIPDAEIPFLVRLYLSERRTYLEWVEDERGQGYFWEELILTLQRDNARWNNLIPPE